jgi:hypothetical protein
MQSSEPDRLPGKMLFPLRTIRLKLVEPVLVSLRESTLIPNSCRTNSNQSISSTELHEPAIRTPGLLIWSHSIKCWLVTGKTDRHFSWFWLVVSGKYLDTTIKLTTIESFHILSNSPYIIILQCSWKACRLENREYGRGDPLRWPRNTLYP